MDLGKAFQESWETFKKYPGPLTIGYAILSFVSSVASGLILGNVFAGFAYMTQKAFAGEEPKIDDCFKGFDNFADKFIAGLIQMSGVLLCCVGAPVTQFLFLYAPIIVQLRGTPWKEACKESKELVMANFGGTVLLMLAVMGINTLGILACGVGVFVSAPLSLMMVQHCYMQLSEAT